MTSETIRPLTLYSGPLSMFGAKCHIAALEKDLPVQVVMVPFTMEHRYEPKHPEVLRVNPKRQVPILVHDDVEIFDSTQIFEYFEELKPTPPLWPKSRSRRAQARLLELKSDEVFFPHVIRLMGMQDRLKEAPAVEAIAALYAYYQDTEVLLGHRHYFMDEYSYADIAFFMAQLFAARMGAPMGSQTPHLLTWRARVAHRPAVRPVLEQLVETLTQHRRPIPPFMLEAVSKASG